MFLNLDFFNSDCLVLECSFVDLASASTPNDFEQLELVELCYDVRRSD